MSSKKNDNKFPCCYCKKKYSTKTVLKTHKQKNKTCLKIQKTQITQTNEVQPPPYCSVKILSPQEIRRIELQKELDELDKSPSELKIMELEKKVALLEKQVEEKDALAEKKVALLEKQVEEKDNHNQELMRYKSLYETIIGEDEGMLKFFDIEKEGLMNYMNAKLQDYDDKLNTQNEIRMIYSYFFPEYWQCVDKKRKKYIYKDENGQIQVDICLEKLKSTCKNIFKWYDENRDFGDIFNKMIGRMVELENGVEKGETIEAWLEEIS